MDFLEFTDKLDKNDPTLIESIQKGYIAMHESQEFNDLMDSVYELNLEKLLNIKERGYRPSNALIQRAVKILQNKFPSFKKGEFSGNEYADRFLKELNELV
jgi:hypothetical protein